jgi:hypothetical protein
MRPCVAQLLLDVARRALEIHVALAYGERCDMCAQPRSERLLVRAELERAAVRAARHGDDIPERERGERGGADEDG